MCRAPKVKEVATMAPVVVSADTTYPMRFKVLNWVSDVLTGDLPRSSKATTAVVANDQ